MGAGPIASEPQLILKRSWTCGLEPCAEESSCRSTIRHVYYHHAGTYDGGTWSLCRTDASILIVHRRGGSPVGGHVIVVGPALDLLERAVLAAMAVTDGRPVAAGGFPLSDGGRTAVSFSRGRVVLTNELVSGRPGRQTWLEGEALAWTDRAVADLKRSARFTMNARQTRRALTLNV